MSNKRKLRSALLAGASTALIASFGSTSALADPSVNETASHSIAVEQQFNEFTDTPIDRTLNGNSEGTINATINSNDPANYALQNSTVSVGSSATNGNSSSANGYANTADLTVNADLNNVDGTGLASQNAQSNGATDGASVTAVGDIGIALTQQNIATNATVSDSTDLGIALDNGATGSTATIVGNKHGATAVLNAGTNALNADVNNSSGSLGIGSAQSSVNSTLAATQSSLDSFVTGSGTSGIALDSSTVELTGNSQAATAVANSVANTQGVTGNDLALAAGLPGQAQAGSAGSDATAIAGYATAAKQQLEGGEDDDAASVSATIDSVTGGFLAQVTGDISGSTLNNDSNSAKALARGNEAVNATTFDANSVATTGLGSVAAIASQQDVTGTVAINAGVTGAGVNGPMAVNLVDGDVADSSAITASNNTVLADAAGNRGGNTITASATTIDTTGTLAGLASNSATEASAVAAFAVANKQSVSADTTISAGLVDDVTTPTSGTSVATAVSGSVADSSVVSNGNQLTAAAAGNTTLTGGNAITLSGTNVATNAAVSNVQTLDGSIAATVGSEGVAPVAPGAVPFVFTGSSTGADGNFTFTGAAAGTEADRDALALAYPTLSFNYSAGIITVVATNQLTDTTTFPASYLTSGSAGSPASGGVTVTVGNDISNSSVAVNGNTTSGSAIGNSAANKIVADATNLDNGSAVTAATAGTNATNVVSTADLAVASSQLVGSDATLTSNVGAVFGISAEGIGTLESPELSDVVNSTVSVSDNTAQSTVTGNTADNAVKLSATNVSNTSALTNNQEMDGTLAANIADFSGASAVIGRDISGSSVLVDGNTFTGTTTGNDATNKVAVDGSSTLAQGDGTAGAIADPSNGTAPTTIRLAQADHALANLQTIGSGATLATNVTAGYGITTLGAGAPSADPDTSDVANSTLSVSDNVQSAKTTGNSASNGVDISGGSVASDGALLSVQAVVNSTLTANSTMTVGAPAANSASTLALNSNANSASATINTATNAMTVAAATDLASTTVDAGPPVTQGTNAVLSGDVSDDYGAAADYVVNNFQYVTNGSVGATAESTISNNDGTFLLAPLATDGIQSSTVTLNGNSTLASATSNSSVNTLALSANSSTASGGVLNQQTSGAGVTSNAAATVGVAVAGFDDAVTDSNPVNNSAATISGNATVARAGGNSSSNSLSAAATTFANNSEGGITSLNADRADSVAASFAVLNEQANSGPINATATVTYGAAFNTIGSALTVTNSALTLSGNSAASVAYGNATTNELTFAALNSPVAPGTVPTTTAIASNQFNSGNVTATTVATNVSFGVNSPSIVGSNGSVSQSSLSITGNARSAAAYGNSATNTLTISGNNVNVGTPIVP